MNKIKSETPAIYGTMQNDTSADDAVLLAASEIIDARFARDFAPLDNPGKTQEYLKIKLGSLEHEVFVCLMLDNRHRVIAYRELFRGTLDGCSIYPREVVKQALADNAAAVILVHNHPSGTAEPSQADIQITERLKKALALFDIRVLDHIIIGKETLCFSERGLI